MFFLVKSEIAELVDLKPEIYEEDKNRMKELISISLDRKINFKKLGKITEMPMFLYTHEDPLQMVSQSEKIVSQNVTSVFNGLPVSIGVSKARVRVVFSVEEANTIEKVFFFLTCFFYYQSFFFREKFLFANILILLGLLILV